MTFGSLASRILLACCTAVQRYILANQKNRMMQGWQKMGVLRMPISHHNRVFSATPPALSSSRMWVLYPCDPPTTILYVCYRQARLRRQSVTQRQRHASSYKYHSPPQSLLPPPSSTFINHPLPIRLAKAVSSFEKQLQLSATFSPP